MRTEPAIIAPQWKRFRALERRLRRLGERWRDRVLARGRSAEERASCEVVLVPARIRKLRPIAARRIRKLAERVQILAEWAARENASEDAAQAARGAEASAVVSERDGGGVRSCDDEAMGVTVAAACIACQGACCWSGGDHAYLDVPVMQRWLREHPGSGVDDVVEAYVARIGTRTEFRSCVFHGAQGCTLPREMRSRICNEYLCDPLRDWVNAHDGAPPARAFYMAVAGAEIERAALADGGLVQLVRRPAGVEKVVVVR